MKVDAMHPVLGDRVVEACRTAVGEVLVVAPFIKDHALARLIAALPPSVTGVTCVTRWLPEEVACGISDLEVFDRLSERPGSSLLLMPTLHAKLFCFGDRCLVGSANVTGRAMGWRTPPNLEILVEVAADHPDIRAFLRALHEASCPASAAARDEVAEAARRLLAQGNVATLWDAIEDPSATAPHTWLPRCTRPDQLWLVYSDDPGKWMLVSSNVEAAEADLRSLGVPRGLSRDMFMRYVAALFVQMPLVANVDRRAAAGIDDREAVALIRSVVPDGEIAPDVAWSVLKDWIVHFLPNIYRRTAQGEVFVRGRTLGPF